MYLECRHIMPTGIKCKSPALRGKHYCYFHYNLRLHADDGTRDDKEPLKLPSLEDSRGIQIALAQILAALGSGRIDSRQAGLYLYGLQIAAKIASRTSEPEPKQIVRVLECDDTGATLAPEQTACDPDLDCGSCPRKAQCHNGDVKKHLVQRLVLSLGEKLNSPARNSPNALCESNPRLAEPDRRDPWNRDPRETPKSAVTLVSP